MDLQEFITKQGEISDKMGKIGPCPSDFVGVIGDILFEIESLNESLQETFDPKTPEVISVFWVGIAAVSLEAARRAGLSPAQIVEKLKSI